MTEIFVAVMEWKSFFGVIGGEVRRVRLKNLFLRTLHLITAHEYTRSGLNEKIYTLLKTSNDPIPHLTNTEQKLSYTARKM